MKWFKMEPFYFSNFFIFSSKYRIDLEWLALLWQTERISSLFCSCTASKRGCLKTLHFLSLSNGCLFQIFASKQQHQFYYVPVQRGCVITRFSLTKEGVCKIASILVDFYLKIVQAWAFQTTNYGYSIRVDNLINATSKVRLESFHWDIRTWYFLYDIWLVFKIYYEISKDLFLYLIKFSHKSL